MQKPAQLASSRNFPTADSALLSNFYNKSFYETLQRIGFRKFKSHSGLN